MQQLNVYFILLHYVGSKLNCGVFCFAHSYPSSNEKLMLAKSVVTLFPSLKIKMGETNEGFVSIIS